MTLIVPDTITFTASDGRVYHHPAIVIYEEMHARCWTSADLARMWGGDREAHMKALTVDMYMANAAEPCVRMGDDVLAALDRAFGTDPGFFLALERGWLAALASRPEGASQS